MDKMKKNPWMVIIVAILILSFLFTVVSSKIQQDTLDVYSASNKVETDTGTSEEKQAEIPTEIYTDGEYGLSVEIPTGWESVTQDGYQTFIHKASGASVQLQIKEYIPSVNTISPESASVAVAENGYTFVNFTKTGNASYDLLYQDQKNTVYDYIEHTVWDRSRIITLKCVFRDENYEKIMPYYEKILSSFSWKQETPIPEGFYLYYAESLNAEFGILEGWVFGESESAVYALDESSGASLSVTALQSQESLDGLTATDATKLLKSGYSNFMLSSFDTEAGHASVVFTHIKDFIQYTCRTEIYANGEYLTFIAFDYEKGMFDESIVDTCIELYRDFSTAE